MSTTPRAVRIPRLPGPTKTGPSGSTSPTTLLPSEYERNTGGSARGLRLFLLFSIGNTLLYAIFLELTLLSAAPGVRTNSVALVLLTVFWLAFVIWNRFLTIGRAPRGIRRTPREFEVTDRYGRRQTFHRSPESPPTVLRRYPSSWLNSMPVELIRLRTPSGRHRVYLISEGLVRVED